MIDTPHDTDPPSRSVHHEAAGGPAGSIDADAALDAAERLRWTEELLLVAMSAPTDWLDLLDAAVGVLVDQGCGDRLDALAVRVSEIIPEALP